MEYVNSTVAVALQGKYNGGVVVEKVAEDIFPANLKSKALDLNHIS